MLWFNYTPSKEIVDISFKVMLSSKFFLSIHVVDAPIKMYDNQFVRSRSGKNRRKLRKILNKLKRMNGKMTKRLTSPISPLKRTHWNDEKRAR